MKEFIVPERSSDNFGEPFSKLSRLLAICNSLDSGDSIHISFERVKFMSPFFIGGIACIINHLKENNIKVHISIPENSPIGDYLSIVKFPDGLINANGNLDEFKGKTYVPLVYFTAKNTFDAPLSREKSISAFENLLRRQVNMDSKLTSIMAQLIAELTNNVADHSLCDNGIIYAQYFPSKNFIDLCITDNGQGIFNSYTGNKRFKPETNEEALRMALKGNSTKDRAESRGYGISTSRKLLSKGLRGAFFIWSGSSFFTQTYNREDLIKVPDDFHFQGCYIALRIPTIIPQDFDLTKYLE